MTLTLYAALENGQWVLANALPRKTALGVPRVATLDYYVTSSADAALNILGAEVPEKYGPHGGFSKPVNHQLFSGIPTLGEDYR